MTTQLAALKARLMAEELSCIVRCEDRVYTSKVRGIRSLLDLIDGGEEVAGGMAADRIVGKAAALLYAHLGIGEVYAEVLSESGLFVLRSHNIAVEYATLVPHIINRTGTGICPMEETVLAIDDPASAVVALREKADALRRQKEEVCHSST